MMSLNFLESFVCYISIVSLLGRPIFLSSFDRSEEISPFWLLLPLEAFEPFDAVFLMGLCLGRVGSELRRGPSMMSS